MMNSKMMTKMDIEMRYRKSGISILEGQKEKEKNSPQNCKRDLKDLFLENLNKGKGGPHDERIHNETRHLILITKNKEGYNNLLRLLKKAEQSASLSLEP